MATYLKDLLPRAPFWTRRSPGTLSVSEEAIRCGLLVSPLDAWCVTDRSVYFAAASAERQEIVCMSVLLSEKGATTVQPAVFGDLLALAGGATGTSEGAVLDARVDRKIADAVERNVRADWSKMTGAADVRALSIVEGQARLENRQCLGESLSLLAVIWKETGGTALTYSPDWPWMPVQSMTAYRLDGAACSRAEYGHHAISGLFINMFRSGEQRVTYEQPLVLADEKILFGVRVPQIASLRHEPGVRPGWAGNAARPLGEIYAYLVKGMHENLAPSRQVVAVIWPGPCFGRGCARTLVLRKNGDVQLWSAKPSCKCQLQGCTQEEVLGASEVNKLLERTAAGDHVNLLWTCGPKEMEKTIKRLKGKQLCEVL